MFPWMYAARTVLQSSRRLKSIAYDCLLSRNLAAQSIQSTQQHYSIVERHLTQSLKKHSEVVKSLSSPEKLSTAEFRKLSKLASKLQPLVHLAEQLSAKQEEHSELQSMLSSSDKEIVALAQEDIANCFQDMASIQEKVISELLPKEETDQSSVILEVRSGAGGNEASLFSAEMLQMYQRYATFKRWKFEMLSFHASDVGGVREATASIEGGSIFRDLKHERGVHRIQRVPQTESMGRIHTSTMSVVVMPQPEEVDVVVDAKDLKIDTFKSSGAGGQHVNTTDSAVRMTHLPTGTTVSMQEERSQHKNRSKALKVLKARLFNVQLLKSQEERKMERKQQIGSLERFERIRTYNFPQDRVTDHRLGSSMHGIEDFMAGGESLERVVQQLVEQEEARALEVLLAS